MSFNIAGAGPAGLFTGLNLLNKGFDVKIYDKKSRIGFPQHCTGIVSSKTIDLYNMGRSIITKKLYGIALYTTNRIYTTKTSAPKAFLIDRIKFEELLAEEVAKRGGQIILNRNIKNYNEADVLIDARGAWIYFKLVKKGVLPALQVDYECLEDLDIDKKIAHIYISKKLNKDYFHWIIHLKDNVFRIGTASRKNLFRKIEEVRSKFFRKCRIVKRYYGFIISGGPLKRFYLNRRILIGDAAGQVKPTTGGGLYYIGIASKLLSKNLYEGHFEYSKDFYSLLGREIKLQKLARRVFENLDDNDIERILSFLSNKELLSLLVNQGSMDHHVSSIISLVGMDALKSLIKNREIVKSIFKAYVS